MASDEGNEVAQHALVQGGIQIPVPHVVTALGRVPGVSDSTVPGFSRANSIDFTQFIQKDFATYSEQQVAQINPMPAEHLASSPVPAPAENVICPVPAVDASLVQPAALTVGFSSLGPSVKH